VAAGCGKWTVLLNTVMSPRRTLEMGDISDQMSD
jgi:hypothetical protein